MGYFHGGALRAVSRFPRQRRRRLRVPGEVGEDCSAGQRQCESSGIFQPIAYPGGFIRFHDVAQCVVARYLSTVWTALTSTTSPRRHLPTGVEIGFFFFSRRTGLVWRIGIRAWGIAFGSIARRDAASISACPGGFRALADERCTLSNVPSQVTKIPQLQNVCRKERTR